MQQMKLLLTSNGITNQSIAKALEELVGKAAGKTKIAFVPTAASTSAVSKIDFTDYRKQLEKYGYAVKTVEISEVHGKSLLEKLKACDVVCIGGGNPFFLSYWMRKSGLFDMMPGIIKNKVYVGISAGSAIVGPSLALTSYALVDQKAYQEGNYDKLAEPGKAAGEVHRVVDFIVRPHFNDRFFFSSNTAALQNWADKLNTPIYALDDESAVKISDDFTTVVSEGRHVRVVPKSVLKRPLTD